MLHLFVVNMSLKGKGSVYMHAKDRMVIYIPSEVRKDSAFPFEVGEKLEIKIDKKRLVVEKIK